MWEARYGHGFVVYDKKMWILGGLNKLAGFNNDVWYSEDGISWTCATKAASWSERGFFATAVYDNKIWVLGGKAGASILNDVWCSTDGKTWTSVTASAAWPERQYFEAFVIDKKMWVAGGSGKSIYNDVWYSTDGKTWSSAPAASWPKRSKLAAAVFNDGVWISGGKTGISYLNDIWHTEFASAIQNSGKPFSRTDPVTVNAIRTGASGRGVTIQYTMNRAGRLNVGIYACTGRLISLLRSGAQAAATYSLVWNGDEALGTMTGAGTYFIRFKTDDSFLVRKIVVAE